MKLALEALENTYAYLPRRWGGEVEADQAISALRQAIAEAEKQEPVAWMYVNKDGECEQIEYGEPIDDPSITLLYAAPPKREWLGLTDEDRQELAAEQHSWEGLCFAVEAKLKEKNHG
jgi:hypothetical protein